MNSFQTLTGPDDRAKPLLVAIVGPTASGKSSLALEAAGRFGGEIVNCDSMQMVRGLNIGTAKPTPAQMGRVPHHLYDRIDPDEIFSAGQYMVLARGTCRQIVRRGKVPFVVGGTGLYLRALLRGMFAGPGRIENLRLRLAGLADTHGTARLHRLLIRKDPEAAGRISPADRIRIIRALEVYFSSGVPISRYHGNQEPLQGFRVLKIGLRIPRRQLYARINARVENMYQKGLLSEVESLLARGFPPDSKGFEALGYRHAIACLEQRLSRQEAVELTSRDTRRYAKRQMTWFRRESEMHWIEAGGEQPEAFERLIEIIEA